MPTELIVTAAKNESTSSAVARPMTIHSRSVNGPRPCCAFDGGWVAGCSWDVAWSTNRGAPDGFASGAVC